LTARLNSSAANVLSTSSFLIAARLARWIPNFKLCKLVADGDRHLLQWPLLTAKKLQMEERKLVIQWIEELINLNKPEIAAQIACAWIKMNFDLGGTNAQFDEIYEHLPALKEQMQGFNRVEEFGDHLISRAALGHDVKRATREGFSVISSSDQLLALQEVLDLISALLKDPAVFFIQNNRAYESDQLVRTQRCIQKALRVSMTRENRRESNLLSETLAATYVLQKNFNSAETVCRALCDISDLTVEDRSRYYLYLGAVLAFQNQPEESETMLKKSIESLDNISVSGYEVLMTALERLGTFYTTIEDYERAEPLFKRVLELRHKASGEQNSENVQVLMKLGELYVIQNDLAQAEIFMESAVDTALAIYSAGAKLLNEVLVRYSKILAQLSISTLNGSIERYFRYSSYHFRNFRWVLDLSGRKNRNPF
jgi:tetratricopeptide (TPR) repeat protein